MKRLFIILIIFFTTLIWSKNSFAAAQVGDLLIIGNDTVWIFSNPLEEYFVKKGNRTIGNIELHQSCITVSRGYVATWKLENDSLFLIRIQTDYCRNKPNDIDIFIEFNTNKVFAKWVNSKIIRPEGEMLQYVYEGYLSIYEGETYYTFNNGILTNKETSTFIDKDESMLFPGQDFLADTIRKIILKSVPMLDRKDFEDDDLCNITIMFDKDGHISQIGLGYGKVAETIMEKTLETKAKEVLKDFPKLMKVNHERYQPLKIQVWFRGYCLKYPLDRESGCDSE